MPELNKEQIIQHAQERGLRPALVVTALPLEMRAVRAHLSHLGSVQGRSGTVYECGQFSGTGDDWFVVVAESGVGTHAAQSVVSSAHIDFHNFEVVIFVGIAASRKTEAPIGSVVASTILYFPYSGKFEPRGFSSRPHTLPVDHRLVGLARKVERDAEWQTRILPPLRGSLPDQGQYPQPFPPNAAVAPIASIEAVSADPNSQLESIITLYYGDTLAIEMEGYGAAYAAYGERSPLIVVRGISDMRGGKSPKMDAIYQPVAAAHAAAFAFELLHTWGRFQPRHATMSLQTVSATNSQNIAAPQPGTATSKGETARDRSVVVLNFAGTAADFPPEKIDQILQTLKTISNDPSLEVIRTEEGSFRIFLEGRSEDRRKIDTPETYEALSHDFSVKLLGVLAEAEYLEAKNLEETLRLASRDLLDWPRNLPDGTYLPRPELYQLLSIVDENEGSTTALLGLPGSGKSALLASFGHELVARRVPFLAIKADFLEPSIQTEENLTACLQLPISVSSLLIQISQLRPVVLLIDQLDALAGYVDLRTGRLNVLLNLVRKLGGSRNIHIVLSSRTFEFEHDTRLKTVMADSLTLTLPPWSTVLQVLERHGILAAGWPVDAQELMRSPQALATFLKLNDRTQHTPFRTYQSMLDRLWNEQVLAQPDAARVAELAGMIAESMAARETLWLAAARFEDQASALHSLIAKGFLTDYDGTGSRVGFSHQTVFEHILARSFAKGDGKLAAYILERQSSLFIRPKLWAALTYVRDIEPDTYQVELQAIWSAPDLRLHLRLMLIEFLGQQSSPTTGETLIFDQALSSSNRRVALQAMAGSVGWLNLFSSTHLAAAMVDTDVVNAGVAILDKGWSFAFEVVKSLIKMNWVPDATFDRYAWEVLQNSPTWDDELTNIAKTIIERTDISPLAIDYTISTVGLNQPEVALKLISAKLFRQLSDASKEAEARTADMLPDKENQQLLWRMTHQPSDALTKTLKQADGWDSLEALATANPKLFLEYVWPWFKETLKTLRRFREDNSERPGFPLPFTVDFRFADEHSLGLSAPPLLGAISVAIESLANGNQSEFLEWLAAHEDEDTTPAQRLFAHGLASKPECYAERAAKFLLDNKNRFHLGSYEDDSGTTKRLVKVTSPFWSDQTMAMFSQELLSYSPMAPTGLDAKGRKYFNNSIRRTRLGILTSLPADRISSQVRKSIAEERRRYPKATIGARVYEPGFIGSPIAAQNLALASDADILNAFREIPDASGWDHPRQWRKGGNIQLSREFAEFAKKNPERAMRIIKLFEPSFGTRASGYALDAMAETAQPSMILELIDLLDHRKFQGEEFQGNAARAIQRLIGRDVPIGDETVAILERWLSTRLADTTTEMESTKGDEDEAPNESDVAENKAGEKERTESVLWGDGEFRILPQGNFSIIETITSIFLQREEHDRLLALYVKHLQVDENEEVWQALLRYFTYIRPTHPANFSAFLSSLFKRYPNLLATREASVMLVSLHWQLPELLHEVILTWRQAKNENLQQMYGEIVTFMAVMQPNLDWPQSLLTEIVEAKEMRSAHVGAAYTAVNLWPEQNRRAAASQILKTLVPMADEDTWVAIFDLFRIVDEITPDKDWVTLLEVISEHIDRAKSGDSSFIVERLQTLLPHQALLVAKIAKGLVANWYQELGNQGTRKAMNARDLVDLAITLHRLGPETREVGTSLFEDLLLVSAYTARETLDEIDNRFTTSIRQTRRRLPRRARHPRVRENRNV